MRNGRLATAFILAGICGWNATTAAQTAPRQVTHHRHGRHRRHRRRRETHLQPRRRRDRRDDHRCGGAGGRYRGALQGGRADQRSRFDRHSRSHQHTRARADGAVPRPRRRSASAGMAREVHLSGRSEDRLARDGARRHAARRARDDSVGHDGVCRHVLLRGRNRARDESRGHARRPRADHHPVSGRRCEDAAGGPGAQRGVHQGVREGRSHRPGGCAALAVHARRQGSAGLARSGDAGMACRC